MDRPTVMVADDHVVFSDGIVRILEDRFDVVGTVVDGGQLVEAASRLHPDVIVMDISMPRVSGLEALRRLKEQHDDSKIVVLTMYADAKLAEEAFRLGANGFVLKQSSSEELVDAIDAVLSGHKYLAAALTDEVFAFLAGPADPAAVELSTRQKEVLRLIVSGHRMKEIAARLNLSARTVENIKYEMMSSLHLHSTAELVRYAIEHRLVMF